MKFERREGVAFGNPYHHYYLDEQRLPGVTTILSLGLPAPALVEWAAKTTAAYAVDHWDELSNIGAVQRFETLRRARWDVSTAAALRGTEIHELAWALVTGEPVEVPDEHLGPVQAVARFMDTHHLEPVLREAPVLHAEHGWAGTVDLTAGMGGVLWLLDWKTGKGIYDKDVLQQAAYAHATHFLREGVLNDWVPPERCGLVHVTPDSAELHEVDAGDATYLTFRYIQQVASWARRVEDARKNGDAWPIGPAA